MKTTIYVTSLVFLTFFLKISVTAQAIMDIGTGAVFTDANNVRIPGNLGTNFSLKDDLNANTQ